MAHFIQNNSLALWLWLIHLVLWLYKNKLWATCKFFTKQSHKYDKTICWATNALQKLSLLFACYSKDTFHCNTNPTPNILSCVDVSGLPKNSNYMARNFKIFGQMGCSNRLHALASVPWKTWWSNMVPSIDRKREAWLYMT